MDLHTLTFIFGALLLLIGILGGGFEVKELKIPKVGWSIRLASMIVGAVFIATGLNVIEVPRVATDKSVATEISELENQIRAIDIQIQALEEQSASSRRPPGSLHELQETRQERERRLAEIESLQIELRSELEHLRSLENGDPGVKRRIEQIEGETIPDLEAEKRAVQTELGKMHDMIRNAEKGGEVRGKIAELNEQKQFLQEEIDRLQKK